MSFEWLSVYDCVDCGATHCSTSVEYNPLGFSVCERCSEGRRQRPLRN
jgi:hypothetical protein